MSTRPIRLREAVGAILRQVREDRGLTLRDVQVRSRGGFKPSSLGGYERGEREISLQRFCDLAAVYEMPADRLLGRVLGKMAPEGREEAVIDLARLDLVPGEQGRRLAEFVHDVKTRRGDYRSQVITLRSGDIEVLATAASVAPRGLLASLRPALRDPDVTRPQEPTGGPSSASPPR